MNIIVIIIACVLVYLTFQYIRQRVEERRNEELNRDARKVYEKALRRVRVEPPEYTTDNLPNIAVAFRYIGNIAFYDKLFQDGDIGFLYGREMVYANGTWHNLY